VNEFPKEYPAHRGSNFELLSSLPSAPPALVPPHLVEKWAREALRTVPGIRVFLIDDMRNGGDEKAPQGVNEVRLKRGMIVREGLRTTLSDLRLRKQYRSSRERWFALCIAERITSRCRATIYSGD